MATHPPVPHPSRADAAEGGREEAFFSRADHSDSQGPRVSLFARHSDNPKAPRFDGTIGDVPVALFLRQPAGRAPFLSIVGALGSPRAKENMGTARVVTSLSGAPRLLMHLNAPMGATQEKAGSTELRLFVSVAKSMDHAALVELGLDERRQQAKRAAWESTRLKVVRPQDLDPDAASG